VEKVDKRDRGMLSVRFLYYVPVLLSNLELGYRCLYPRFLATGTAKP